LDGTSVGHLVQPPCRSIHIISYDYITFPKYLPSHSTIPDILVPETCLLRYFSYFSLQTEYKILFWTVIHFHFCLSYNFFMMTLEPVDETGRLLLSNNFSELS